MTGDEVLNKLVQYGADIDGINKRFMDDIDFYAECMRVFFDDENFALLDKAMAAKDYETAFDAAHALKGVAGTMGLTPLYDSVCALVEALRTKSYGNVDTLYTYVLAHIARVKKLNIE